MLQNNVPPANEELIFEFYSDESSLFDTATQDWLIAGYLRPRKLSDDGISTSDSDVVQWWSSVCTWFGRKYRGYIGECTLAHCGDRDNVSSRVRREIQTAVLKMLCKNISEVGGFPVVFSCPKGACTKNSELNYLTVLTYGYLQLIQEMRRRFPKNTVRIVPVISKTVKTEYLAASSTQSEIDKLLQYYRVVLGTNLYPYFTVGEMDNLLNDLTIIHGNTTPYASKWGQLVDPRPEADADLQAAQRGVIRNLSVDAKHNLHNIVADYICNSYFSDIDKKGRSIIESCPNAFICMVPRNMSTATSFIQPLPVPQPAPVKQPEQSKQPEEDKRLLTAFHADMLQQFNASAEDAQRETIRLLCTELKPLVERQIEMEKVLDELDELLNAAKKISRSAIRAEMTANLLLFKIALLNHLGKIYAADGLSRDFVEAVNKMPDDFERNALLFMFFNRQIVLSTDLNDYEKAENYYLRAEQEWSKHLIDYADHFKQLHSSFTPSLSSVICPEYGKTIGSVLQTARHRMRLSGRGERFNIYLNTLHRARAARFHMEEPADLSRLEQTLCDLESEAGYYDSAFQHLLKAAQLLNDEPAEDTAPASTMESCTQILTTAGKNGSENPFLLSHYARLLSEMLICGNPSAKKLADTMFEALLEQKNPLSVNAYQCIRSIHPRTQIMWKLGSAAVRRGMEKEGNKLLNAAFEQLSSSDAGIFHAIAVSVCAEQAHLNNADAQLISDMQSVYNKFLDTKPMEMLDPFENSGIESLSAADADISKHLLEISRVIAY